MSRRDVRTFVMTQGLPASGKSTWAEEMVLLAPAGQAVRVNRDLIRTMLHVDRFDGRKTEDLTLGARDDLITMAMARGVPLVISDDTNFDTKSCEKIFRGLCEAYGYSFEIHDFTDVPVKECIARDLKRARSVGKDVIMKMYRKHLVDKPLAYEVDDNLEWAVLVDIDGTLAHMVDRGPFEWTRVGEDERDDIVHELVVGAKATGYRIIVMSGRDAVCRPETEAWLKIHDIEYDALHMRPEGSTITDSIVKAALFDEHVRGKYNVAYVLDDRNQVVDMWRSMGLKVLQVEEGDF